MFKLEELSDKDKIEISSSLMAIFEDWKLSDKEQINLLALPQSFKTCHLYSYHNGDKVFHYTSYILARAEALIGIYNALGTTYPTHRAYGTIWLKRPVKKFNHKTPLELMLSGDVGIKRVWHFLDCTQSWQD